MNRREFLRCVEVAGAAVVAAPLMATAAAPAYEELPRGTYGQFRITTRAEDLRDDAILRHRHASRPCNYDDIVRGAYDGYKMFWT